MVKRKKNAYLMVKSTLITTIRLIKNHVTKQCGVPGKKVNMFEVSK